MSKKKKIPFGGLTVALLSASVLLLAGSTVGSARAALTYYSENYGAQVEISNIGVTLVENGKPISYRNYESNGNWDEATGTLLSEEEKIVPGKKYKEELKVKNSGSIDTYVRVIVKKSWVSEKDGKEAKDTSLSPDLIKFNFLSNDWMIDESASTKERTILYYSKILGPGAETDLFSDSISIDNSIAKKVRQNVTEENGHKTITTTYVYDGYKFKVEAEVDAVQTHNAQDAIKSAWGVDVNLNGKDISLPE